MATTVPPAAAAPAADAIEVRAWGADGDPSATRTVLSWAVGAALLVPTSLPCSRARFPQPAFGGGIEVRSCRSW